MASDLRSFGRICSLLVLLSSVAQVCSQTVTASVQPQPASQVKEGVVVTLRCRVRDFDPSSMFMSWTALFGGGSSPQILTWNGATYGSEPLDPRFSVRNNTYPDVVEHSLIINTARTNHSGTYKCRVMRSQIWRNIVVAAEQVDLTVYPSRVFPICSPNGTAEVASGSPLSCTVSTTYSRASIINTEEEWDREELSPGVRLTAPVSDADNGQTYTCSSVSTDYPGLPFICQIGPLSVPPPPVTTASLTQVISTNPPSDTQATAKSESTPEGTSPTLQPNASSASTPAPKPTPGDSPAPKKPEPDTEANPPVPAPGGKFSNTANNSPTEPDPPKPRPPATSRVLTAFLIIIVIAVVVISVVALVITRRKQQSSSESQEMDYHKVDNDKI